MDPRNRRDETQAKTVARNRAFGCVAPIEHLQYRAALGWRDAGAGIGDRQ